MAKRKETGNERKGGGEEKRGRKRKWVDREKGRIRTERERERE